MVLFLVFMGVKYYLDRQASAALVAYDQALSRIAQIKSLNDENNQGDIEQAIKALEHVRNVYARSAQGRFVLLDLGTLYFHLKQYDKAKDSYQEYLKDLRAEENFLKPLILDSLAYINEAEKNLDKAAAHWEEVTRLEDGFLKEEAFFNLGRVYEALNKNGKALKAYEKLMAAYPDSSNIPRAKAKAASLSQAKSE